LVRATNDGQRLTVEGLTRNLANARLASDDRAKAFRERFVAHFLSYAKAHAQQTPEDFAALEAEKDNVLGAIDAAFALEDWESVTRTRAAIEDFLDLSGYWGEAIRSGEQALEAARDLSVEPMVAGFAHNLAMIYQRRGELDEARRLYDESLEISKKISNQSSIAGTLHQLGWLAQDQGEVDEARRLYNESLEIKNRLGDQSGIAITLHQLGRLAEDQGEVDEARRLYDESLEISKKIGDQSGIAITLHQLGRLAEDEGNKEEAARLFREALSIFEKLGSPNANVARRSLERVEGKSS
jgi:tetratricopeptide (TPR) repeat protein